MSRWSQLTAAERQALVTGIRQTLAVGDPPVPHHLRDGLVRYFCEGILPGGFLQACLTNNLLEAVSRAAPGGLYAVVPVMRFLQFYAPPEAWGSRDAVLAWTTTPNRLEV